MYELRSFQKEAFVQYRIQQQADSDDIDDIHVNDTQYCKLFLKRKTFKGIRILRIIFLFFLESGNTGQWEALYSVVLRRRAGFYQKFPILRRLG